jgi:hypothetical protein
MTGTHHHEEALAAAYFLLLRREFTPERANQLLGAALHTDQGAIARAAAAHPEFADSALLNDNTLKATLKPYTAQIEAILAADSPPL